MQQYATAKYEENDCSVYHVLMSGQIMCIDGRQSIQICTAHTQKNSIIAYVAV